MIPCDHYSTVRLGKNECLEKTTTEMIHITIILVNRPPTTFYPTDFRFMAILYGPYDPYYESSFWVGSQVDGLGPK